MAELAAMMWIAVKTEGDIEVDCDCKYVVDLFARRPARWDTSGAHGLWLEANRQRLQARQGKITVKKVDSRKSQVEEQVFIYFYKFYTIVYMCLNILYDVLYILYTLYDFLCIFI